MSSFAPIALSALNYRDFKTYWLKAYEPGATTTPKLMATDKTGGTTVAKFELNSDGFPETSGGALITPYINGPYDLWAFPTEAEADANDTANALRFAINVEATDTSAVIDRLNPATLAAWQNDLSAQLGDVAETAERSTGNGGGGTGDVIASGTETGFKIVKHNTLPLSWELRVGMVIDPVQWGAIDGADNTAVLESIDSILTSFSIVDLGAIEYVISKTGLPADPFGHRIFDLTGKNGVTIKGSRARVTVVNHDVGVNKGITFIYTHIMINYRYPCS